MAECNGCPEFERRVEIYSNTDRGCGDEFYIPPPPTDEPEPVDPGPTTDPVAPAPTGAMIVATTAATFAAMYV